MKKTLAELRRIALNKQRQEQFNEGMHGGGILEGVRLFMEENGIVIKPANEIEPAPKKEIRTQTPKRKKEKTGGASKPNPLNPNGYIYGRARIVRG